MLAFILRRFVGLIVVLFCVITITFFLVRLAPGGPFARERKIPPAIEKELLARYKLDGPAWRQSPLRTAPISAAPATPGNRSKRDQPAALDTHTHYGHRRASSAL